MTQGYLKTVIITAWTAMMLSTAIFVGVESATEWMVIAGASMLPPLVMLWWGSPAVTISESIRQAIQMIDAPVPVRVIADHPRALR